MTPPDILLQEIYKRRCLLFVGAGFSVNADLPEEMNMPTGPQLAQELAKQIPGYSSSVGEEVDLPAVATHYENTLGRSSLVKAMAELLHVKDAKPSNVHKQLANIDAFDTIVTTNFESLLERSYDSNKVNVIVGDESISNYSPCKDINIIKIHGDFGHPQEMVITEEDYKEFHEKHPVLAGNMAAWFSTKIPLFIGYELKDPHFVQIRDFLKQALGPFLNQWFVVKFDATKQEEDENLKNDIYIINLRTNGKTKKDTLLEFLCQIHEYITTQEINSLDARTETPQTSLDESKSETSKNTPAGRISHAFSNLEAELRTTLEKFGHTKKDLKQRLPFLGKLALTTGILTTKDVEKISRMQKIRISLIFSRYRATREDAKDVELYSKHLIRKLSRLQTVEAVPVQIEFKINKYFFQDGDILKISGKVSRKLANLPVTVQITGAEDKLVHLSQMSVTARGHFNKAIRVREPLWKEHGKYTITAIYGTEGNNATKTIDYKKKEVKLTDELQLEIDGILHNAPCLIEGGRIKGYYAADGTNTLTVLIDAFADGKLSVEIPRHLLDARKGNLDDSFFVLVDGEETNIDEITSPTNRTLMIKFTKKSKEIIIVGTTIIGGKLHRENTVKILEGSGTPNDDKKYLEPQTLTIKKGQKVTWNNCDSAAHTITSGTVEGGYDGTFDSGLIMIGKTYSVTLEKKGTYRYFCVVHPWQEGKIIVTE